MGERTEVGVKNLFNGLSRVSFQRLNQDVHGNAGGLILELVFSCPFVTMGTSRSDRCLGRPMLGLASLCEQIMKRAPALKTSQTTQNDVSVEELDEGHAGDFCRVSPSSALEGRGMLMPRVCVCV